MSITKDVTNDSILELNLSETAILTSNIEEPVWQTGQSEYKVKVNLPENYNSLYCFLVLSNRGNNRALEVKPMMKEQSETECYYMASAITPRVLKNNTYINLGVIGVTKNESNVVVENNEQQFSKENIVFKSNYIPIKIKNSISTDLTPDDLGSITAIDGLLSLMAKGGKTLEGIEIDENGNVLVKYIDSEKKVNIGNVEVVTGQHTIGRTSDSTKGGGGFVGVEAKLTDPQSGFSGGYNSITEDGAAVGEQAQSLDGFAGGKVAKATAEGAVAIGPNSLSESENAIAIGLESKATYSEDSIVIGSKASADNSNCSVVIGGYYNDTSDPNAAVEKETFSTKSSETVVIGAGAKTENTQDTVVIGTCAKSIGTTGDKKTSSQGAISIGRESVSGLRAGIAIGLNAKAGVNKDEDVLQGSINDENVWGTSAPIAVGRNSWARRPQCISLGHSAKSYHWGCIAIGFDSQSGIGDRLDDSYTYKNGDKDNPADVCINAIAIGYAASASGTKAIAIGNQAIASGINAIQLGYGENTENNTFKVFNKTLVKDNQAIINFNTDSIWGTLNIENGGTGAKNRQTALKNLGIRVRTKSIGLQINAKNPETINVQFDKRYSEPPLVFLSYEGDIIDDSIIIKLYRVREESCEIRIMLENKYNTNSNETRRLEGTIHCLIIEK